MTEGINHSDEPRFPTLEFAEFLENSPPYHPVIISDLWYTDHIYTKPHTPTLTLLCEDESCQGMKFFEYMNSTGGLNQARSRSVVFFDYRCKNCERTVKSYSLLTFGLYEGGGGLVVKLGEWPPFGPKTPARLLRLLGTDKDILLRGRRAECHGLGIGAFTYYRRVVENQKNRLIDEIIKVVQKVETSPTDIIADLTKAKGTFQFSQAMSDVKLAVPQVLLINGHNPLTLLHTALSEGIHDKSDDECLEIAKNVRVVLAGLAEGLGQALAVRKELNEAVASLVDASRKKSTQTQTDKKSGKAGSGLVKVLNSRCDGCNPDPLPNCREAGVPSNGDPIASDVKARSHVPNPTLS